MKDLRLKILAALATLDQTNDDHWTQQGLPRLEVITVTDAELTGIKRGDVTNAAPEFTRDNMKLPEDFKPVAEEAASGEQPPEPPAPEEPELKAMDGSVVDGEADVANLTELEVIEMELAEKTANRDRLEVERDKVLSELKANEREMNELITRRENINRAAGSNVNSIQLYLQTQNRIREEKAARFKALQDAGFDPSKINPHSQLDASMSRKTARGTERPTITPARKPNA